MLPPFPLRRMSGISAAHDEHVPQVDIVELLPLLFGRIRELVEYPEMVPDIVDEHVEAPESSVDLSREVLDLLDTADVGLHDQCLDVQRVELTAQRFAFVRRDLGNCELCTERCECFRRRAADAGAGSVISATLFSRDTCMSNPFVRWCGCSAQLGYQAPRLMVGVGRREPQVVDEVDFPAVAHDRSADPADPQSPDDRAGTRAMRPRAQVRRERRRHRAGRGSR
jgi:hypothetical protein